MFLLDELAKMLMDQVPLTSERVETRGGSGDKLYATNWELLFRNGSHVGPGSAS